jgi:hypothetical protein
MERGLATHFLPSKLNGASWYRQRVAHPCRANAPALGGACYKENPFALFYGAGGSGTTAVNAGKWPERRRHAP